MAFRCPWSWGVLLCWCAACSLDVSGIPRGIDPDCERATEACNGVDDDCDGAVDEAFDLQTSNDHCGRCGNACAGSAVENGAIACRAGSCGVVCDPGFADCDGDPATGCEADLGRAETCGACRTRCEDPTPACESSGGSQACVADCSGGNEACGTSCVDTTSNVSHCGGCDMPCPTGVDANRTCSGSSCGFDCSTPLVGDCDGATTPGCEQSLETTTHCGGCGVPCSRPHASADCTGGICGIGVCDTNWGDCDGIDENGCELELVTLVDCGSCDNACSPANATGDCGSGACTIVACDGGRGDCNGDPADGCEIDLRSDDGNCGTCGNVCTGGTCSMGSCGESCNGADDDGDGLIDEGGGVCPCPVETWMGHGYAFCLGNREWTEARDDCAGFGYHLVKLESAEENDWVAMRADSYEDASWWIGANDRGSGEEGNYRWADGTAVTMTFWAGGQPDNFFDEDCVEFAGGWNNEWNDRGCRNDANFVCEAP